MIVADTNLIVYAMTPDPNLELAQAVLHKDPDWHAPLLWRSEFRNAMAGYMRSGVFTLDQVLSTFRQAEDLMDGQEHEIDAADVMRLVSESNCSAYDCEFVALGAGVGRFSGHVGSPNLARFPRRGCRSRRVRSLG